MIALGITALLCATCVACFWIRAGHGTDVDALEAEIEVQIGELDALERKHKALREEHEAVGRQLALAVQKLQKLESAATHGQLKAAFGGK